MQDVNICLLGFGNVGQSFARLLMEKQDEIQKRYQLNPQVVAIKTGRHGTAINPQGLDLKLALTTIQGGKPLDHLSAALAPVEVGELLERSGANILAENTPVSYQDGQPALDHIRSALSRGIHAVTANKGPVVHGYRELKELARTHACSFFFESTVMDGAPIFALWRETLPAASLVSFRGVLNSTTNLILERMEAGESLDQAASFTQSIGIAETDPSGDVDGWDAAIKVAALVQVLMEIPITPQQVQRQGIGNLTPQQVLSALDGGQRWKLVCTAERTASGIRATVKPQLVDMTDPLYRVSGTSSAVTLQSDVLGALTIQEDDPGPHTTAYGLLADLVNAFRSPLSKI